jgi:hypothetical protein
MEIKQSEVTQANWDEWNKLKQEQECAECSGQLDVRTVPERQALVFGCSLHPTAGYRQRTNYTEDSRRGAAVPVMIKTAIERRMMDSTGFHRAVQLLALRFPDSIKDSSSAALFINDCMRLGLDPLIQPAEAVPVAFRTKVKEGKDIKEKWTVAMVVTEDGALSMAARGCPDEYDGAPATMPLLDYLMREHPQRPFEELEAMAARTAAELCGDDKAWVWVALGRRRSAGSVNPVYGYFTQAERQRATDKKLPAATQPGNQARVRAVKRWVRETFPEARQAMLVYTADLNARSAGIQEAQEWIDAEYRVLDTPTKQPTLISPATAGKTSAGPAPKTPKAARTQGTKQADNKVGDSAKRSTAQRAGQGGDEKTAAAPSGADETTSLSTPHTGMAANPREAPTAVPLDWQWLDETLKKLKWSDKTACSRIKFLIPSINDTGDLKTVLPQLTGAQLGIFTKDLNTLADKQPKLL